jgi:hypothetical protein
MRPTDHFLSELDGLARSSQGRSLDGAGAERLGKTFLGLAAPVIGKDAALGLFSAWQEQCRTRSIPDYVSLGIIAAFVRGEFDPDTMKLEIAYWEDIKDALTEASQEMEMDSLTSLWADLLSRGILK